MNLFDFDFENSEDGQKSKLIFFDTETTGTKENDQIINKLIDVEAMAVHGIRNEDIANKEPFEKSKFYKRVNELNNLANYLIAHNLPFDLARLEYYRFNANCKTIDTLSLGEYEYPLPNYKLQTFRYALFSKEQEELASSKYGVDIKAHNAIGDVVILKLFFDVLIKRLQERENLNYNEALEELVVLSKKPVMVKTFAFGKYRGREIKSILQEDRGYLTWLYNDMKKKKANSESVDENLYATLNELVG